MVSYFLSFYWICDLSYLRFSDFVWHFLFSAISCETDSTFLFVCTECVPSIIKKKSIDRDDTLPIDSEI